MHKFVYIDDAFRKMMDIHVGEHSKVDREWKTDYVLARTKEEAFMKYNRVPSRTMCINDSLGKRSFIWPMDNMSECFGDIDYRYYDDLDRYDFSDLMLMRAQEFVRKNKQIDFYYSGGLDSVAMLVAFREVPIRHELHIIMAGSDPLSLGPDSLKDYILSGSHTIDTTGNLYGMADPAKNIVTTGIEADPLFGSIGNPLMKVTVRDKTDLFGYRLALDAEPDLHLKENEDWNYDFWWQKQRYFNRVRSFRLIKNFSGDKIDLSNYCPFYMGDSLFKWSINQHHKKQINFFHGLPDFHWDNFMSAKTMLRKFVASFCDKDWAYSIGKTRTEWRKDKLVRQLNRVLAITADGTVVARENVGDYLNNFEKIIQL
jgi:hypothetical protein